jgi:hypothetical protein
VSWHPYLFAGLWYPHASACACLDPKTFCIDI